VASDPALSSAAYEGDLARVQRLVRDGADVDARERYGGTPLMAALRKFSAEPKTSGPRSGPSEKEKQRAARKLRIARLLIERGADVRAVDQLGHTPLHFAAMAAGDEADVVAVIDALIARGAEVDPRTDERYGRTPLEYAVDQGVLGRVESLLRHGADANVMTAEGKSLQAVAEERGHAAIAQLLRTTAPR
jgi:ankyrin repeat protein